ncbi:MAG: AI-2E family transporter, partial [Parcubacteria group bacterium]|nr:AI-2E family transporter [Parcubacteria group bacterium]
IIPLFGPKIAAVPAVLIGFLESVPLGFMVLGLYVIIDQFESHLIYPLVVRKVIGISPIIVILALIIGGELAGFLGIILAIPVATTLLEMLSDFEKGKGEQARRLEERA